jgi:hypothetical protein
MSDPIPYFRGPNSPEAATINGTNALLYALINGLGLNTANPSLLSNIKPTAQQRTVAITTISGNDGAALDVFAGCVIIGIYGKLASGGKWVNVTSEASYIPAGVNNLDTVMLTAAFEDSKLFDGANVGFALTGIGSSVQWTAGVFDTSQPVIVIYFNAATIITELNSSNLLPFTSVSNQTTYNLGSALTTMNIAYVIYGNTILKLSQITVSGTNLTINVGGPVQGGLPCYVVPLS